MSKPRTFLTDAEEAVRRHKKVQEEKPLLTGHTRPYLGGVTIRARDDLDPSSTEYTLPKEYRLTAATDLIGVVEIVDVGLPAYDRHGRAAQLPWKPGDIALVSMADVRQEFMLENQQHFVCNAECLFARLHKDNRIEASHDWVITKCSPKRMTLAVTGQDRVLLPDSLLYDGMPSGEVTFGRCAHCQSLIAVDIHGEPAPVTRVVYEEVVDVGPGRMVMGMLRPPDCKKGELVLYSTDWGIPFSVNGERMRAVHFPDILTQVCDAEIQKNQKRLVRAV